MIGVFDSGIGGLSILKALLQELPFEDFIYVADAGHAPYGERDEAHVVARSLAVAGWLLNQNVKALVMACNTATAAAIHLLRDAHPELPIVGIEPALKPSLELSNTRRIGVMATRSTLASAKFRALLDAQAGHANPAEFVLQPCDGLADAIERHDTAAIHTLCERHTQAMGAFGKATGQIDTLVLGCTHYPFAVDTLQALLGPQVQVVDNGEAVARQLRRRLEALQDRPALPGEKAKEEKEAGKVTLFSTGNPQLLEQAATLWLGLPAGVGTLHF